MGDIKPKREKTRYTHPNGCPNYNKHDRCPPKEKIIYDYFDLSLPHWFITIEFDKKSHVLRMKSIHPEWSKKNVW